MDRGSSVKGRPECGIHPHPACGACHETIQRREQHSDNFAQGRLVSSLCGPCAAIMAECAQPVVDALERAGVPYNYVACRDFLKSGNFGLLIGVPLPV